MNIHQKNLTKKGVISLLRGFYTAASGMIAQQRHQESVSNNIANANTPGYKADQATLRSFPEMLTQQMGSKHVPTRKGLNLPTSRFIGGLNTGVYAQELVSDFSQGSIRETDMSTDLALENGTMPDEEGSLFFVVENEDGEERLTRNGHFTIDGEGYLTTNQGHFVLSNNGNPIQPNGDDITISRDGTIQADGMEAQLNIAYIDDVNNLAKEGDDLYTLEGAQIATAAESGADFQVHQGFLEGSTVDELKSMEEMMNAYRSFEQNQRVLKTYDESMGKAVNEIARLG